MNTVEACVKSITNNGSMAETFEVDPKIRPRSG